eukprot:6196215-Prymnesium_polylepis.1
MGPSTWAGLSGVIHGIPGRGFSCVEVTPDSPSCSSDARHRSWWAAVVPVQLYACAIMRRAPWHVQASEAVNGVRRRAEPSYVLPPIIYMQARPVPADSSLSERPLRSRCARPTTTSST